jgi:uncharacterized membrane-anchored protein YitT (DUF2179 family)
MKNRQVFCMQRLYPYLQIAAGTALAALAVNLFMIPNELASGGLNGLMVILHYLWNVPIGPVYFAVNLPVLGWLFRLYGWQSVMKTLFGTAVFSVVLEATHPLVNHPPTQNLLLATIYSGVLIGLGLGLALRVGGSTGGTSALGHVVRHYTGMDLGRFVLVSDFVILALGLVALDVERILYGLLQTYLIARVIQAVLDGFSSSRCLLIITEEPERVARAIMEEVKRGVTRLEGQGEYSGRRRPVLMCVVSENEVHLMKRLVLSADPAAFVVITDAREVAGKGFTLDTEVRRVPFWVAQRGA